MGLPATFQVLILDGFSLIENCLSNLKYSGELEMYSELGEGEADGLILDDSEGEALGLRDTLGLWLGLMLGDKDGEAEGDRLVDGDWLGLILGLILGDNEGLLLGESEGEILAEGL